MKVFRNFHKNSSLIAINFVGLAIVFACLLLSAGFIKRELSYDRHHAKADRIVRMTLQFGSDPVDGRIYGNDVYDVLQQIPEVERAVKMVNITTATIACRGTNRVVNDFYMVNKDFLQVFDVPLLRGHKNEALQRKGQALISESFARQLFGKCDGEELETSGIHIQGRQLAADTVFVSGIFKDVPETSHFHTDMLLHLPEDGAAHAYTYLLLEHQTDIQALAQKITRLVAERELFPSPPPRVLLTPLGDIHLHSRNLREMSANGNIHYLYLIVSANLLLLVVALFNLWLNASLIFSYNRRYYQLLRLHGAPPSAVFKDEALSALAWGVLSIAAGVLAAFYISSSGYISIRLSAAEAALMCLMFLLLTAAVSLLPALKGASYTLFISTGDALKPTRFSYANVKYMLMAQYGVVMVLVILAFGVGKQMSLMQNTQVGGSEKNLLVMHEQPWEVQANNALLKTELLKHTEIEAVTTSFQLPGEALRDRVSVVREGDTEAKWMPVMVAGDDFLPFFNIQLIAGRGFAPGKHGYQAEEAMLLDWLYHQKQSKHVEEYVINRKALALLGFGAPEEAVGKMLRIEPGALLDYIGSGVIVGVTDDFSYAGLYHETTPLLIMQRSVFQHCIMARLDPRRIVQARNVFEKVWREVNPEYPAGYVFMSDVFGRMYRNERSTQQLVYIFSLLCFAITDLGLIVFVAFIIRRRTREVAIRKVHGASTSEIVGMFNIDFIRYIAPAFVVAVPVAWYIMHRWLERFACRASLDWWIFALAGLTVLLLSAASVSLQSWRAANANPAHGIVKA